MTNNNNNNTNPISNEFLYYQSPPKPNNGGSNINTSKAIRRRSRASKKTPTTLLNANPTNFRALVQEFTGCPIRTTSVSLKSSKGPVNLNFGLNTATPLVPHNHNYAPKSHPLPQQKPHDQQQVLRHPQYHEQSQFREKNDPLQDQPCVNYPFNDFVISGDNDLIGSIHTLFQEIDSHDQVLNLMEDEISWDGQLWSNDAH